MILRTFRLQGGDLGPFAGFDKLLGGSVLPIVSIDCSYFLGVSLEIIGS